MDRNKEFDKLSKSAQKCYKAAYKNMKSSTIKYSPH